MEPLGAFLADFCEPLQHPAKSQQGAESRPSCFAIAGGSQTGMKEDLICPEPAFRTQTIVSQNRVTGHVAHWLGGTPPPILGLQSHKQVGTSTHGSAEPFFLLVLPPQLSKNPSKNTLRSMYPFSK